MTFDVLWWIRGSSILTMDDEAVLESAYRTSIYTPATNTSLSEFSPGTLEPLLEVNENLTLFPHFISSGGKDGVLLASGILTANIGTKLQTLGLPTTASPVAGFPSLVYNSTWSTYTLPYQGLAWMMSYNMAKSNSLSPGDYNPISTHFVDDVFGPMLTYLLDSVPGVDGWGSTYYSAALSLPSDWSGTIDFNLETWLPVMFLPADQPLTNSSDWWGYDVADARGQYIGDQYFIMWAMKDNFPEVVKRLPASHFANTPNPNPCTTIQQCFDIFWNLTYQIWNKINQLTKAKCPNAKITGYNIPLDPSFWESSYWDYLPPPYTTQPLADAKKQSFIDKYIRMYDDPAVRLALSKFDEFSASWYIGGHTANPGDPEIGSVPASSSTWTYNTRETLYSSKAEVLSWFNTLGPGVGKPHRAYVSGNIYFDNLNDNNYIDQNTCDILYDKMIDAKFTGAINWSYIPSSTLPAHHSGLTNLNGLLTKLYAYHNFPDYQPSISILQSELEITISIDTDDWPHTNVETFKIWKKGPSDLTFSLLATTSFNSYTDTIEIEGDYSYYVTATEEYDNNSDESNILEVAVNIDNNGIIQGLPPRGPSPDLSDRLGTYDYRFLVDSISESYDLGQEALGPLICMYNTLQQTDINQRQRHRNELESSLRQAYAFIIQKHLNNQQTTYNAIRSLHDHIMNTYGIAYGYEDIEAFLNDQFLQVPLTYAILSNEIGYEITAIGEYRARMRDINLPFQDISLPMNRIGWQNR